MFRKVINLCTNIGRTKALPISLISNRTFDKVLPTAVLDKLSHNLYSTKTGQKNDSAAKERQLKIIKAELIHLHENGKNVPEIKDITPREWAELLTMGFKKRHDHYSVLFRKQNTIKNEKIKDAIRREYGAQRQRECEEEKKTNKHIIYRVGENSLFPRINPQTMNRWRHHKIWRSLIHNDSQLIFDCGFENEMTPIELRSLVNQLARCHSINRLHSTPFFFNLTNIQTNGRLYTMLLKHMPTLLNKSFPMRLSEQLIPDNIAKERLVYLTPDSQNYLKEFNHNDVYIIGGMVDKGSQKPITLSKAERLGIRTAQLPLEQFVRWKNSNKSLTLDQMTKIMLELKLTGDMSKALQHVPTRKVHQK